MNEIVRKDIRIELLNESGQVAKAWNCFRCWVSEYTALQIKQAMVGYGRATKEQVQAMVVRLLSLPGTPSKDAADALACAGCHANADRLASALVAGSLASAGAPLAIARRGVRIRRGRLVAS
jgi:crossover junction endodeoxyribonuclease RuvC